MVYFAEDFVSRFRFWQLLDDDSQPLPGEPVHTFDREHSRLRCKKSVGGWDRRHSSGGGGREEADICPECLRLAKKAGQLSDKMEQPKTLWTMTEEERKAEFESFELNQNPLERKG